MPQGDPDWPGYCPDCGSSDTIVTEEEAPSGIGTMRSCNNCSNKWWLLQQLTTT